MRLCIVVVLLVTGGAGIVGFTLGWIQIANAPTDPATDPIVTVDPVEWGTGRHTFLGTLLPNIEDHKTDLVLEDGQRSRDEFHQSAENRLGAMALNLKELNAKAKTGRAVTREKISEAIDDLTKGTEKVRNELGELRAADLGQWLALKKRLSIALEQLESDYETIFSRFMYESAQLNK